MKLFHNLSVFHRKVKYKFLSYPKINRLIVVVIVFLILSKIEYFYFEINIIKA